VEAISNLNKNIMKKIAVPTRGNVVDEHFGECEKYTVFTVSAEHKIVKTEIFPSPQGCGCKSNIASKLKETGVSVMLAGNMGDGALGVLKKNGIEVYRGCTGAVLKIIESFLQGEINDFGEGCRQHDNHGEGHVCNHSLN